YDVMITTAGRQPERVGGIQVMVNSATGTLNDFLTIPGETDLNPAIVATVDGMRAAAAASAAAAKTSENNATAAMANALSKVDTAEQRVVGPVLFSRPTRLTSGAAGTFIPDSQGTWASWSRAAGRGSSDFINHRGNGTGGYWFYDTDGATIKALAYLNGAGDLTTIGSLTSSNMYIGSTEVLKTGDYGLGSLIPAVITDLNVAGVNQFIRCSNNTPGAPTTGPWAGLQGGHNESSRYQLVWRADSNVIDLRARCSSWSGGFGSWASMWHLAVIH
ncbi:hypothetical protein FOT80_29365, partial [Serratia fonticola]|nr:hypothetical protein [Serratia fonticola]